MINYRRNSIQTLEQQLIINKEMIEKEESKY